MVLNRQHQVAVATSPLARFLNRAKRLLRLDRCEVTVCLLTDAEIARLNRTYRGKRGATDVLSFPSNGQRARRRAGGYLGDIAISPQTARRNARRFSRTLPDELRRLILHGVLHLAGYDHETDHGEMERLEQRLRRRLRLA